jgi:lysozyme
MIMKASKNGIELIKKYEGCKLNAYLCPANVWTIGYGHTKNVKEGDKITQEMAEQLLVNDLQQFENAVNAYCLRALTQNQFDALISFVFNLGSVAFRASTLLKRINANQMELAALEFERWNKAGGKVLEGLTKRRKDEKALFLKK